MKKTGSLQYEEIVKRTLDMVFIILFDAKLEFVKFTKIENNDILYLIMRKCKFTV